MQDVDEPTLKFLLLPAHSKLQEILSYEPSTGEFRWIKPSSRCVKPGAVAGGLKKGRNGNTSYVRIKIDGVFYKAHRLAWKIVTGNDPTETVDHIDGNGLNNAFSNLRLATSTQQHWNRSLESKGYDYEPLYKNRPWRARLGSKRLGSFHTEKEARSAYLKAYREAAGEFAHTSR